MVTALGFEWHGITERSGERLRPGAGSEDCRVGGELASVGFDRGQLPAIEAKTECAGANDRATLANELLDERANQAERVAGVAILANQEAARILARQCGFEL